MKNQKGFVPVIIILVVLIGFVGVYFLGKLKNKNSVVKPTSLPIAESKESSMIKDNLDLIVDPTADWEMYSNNEYSIKFPSTEYTRLGCLGEELTAVKYGTDNRPSPLTMVACERDGRYDLETKTYSNILSDPSLSVYSGYDINGSDIKIDNLNARLYEYTYTSNEEIGPNLSWYALARVYKNNKTYEIYLGDKSKFNLFKQIISTFKFVN